MGGFTPTAAAVRIDFFDPKTGLATAGPEVRTLTGSVAVGVGVAALGNDLLIVGGVDSGLPLTEAWLYDSAAARLRPVGPLPIALSSPTVVALDANRALVVGGKTFLDAASKTVKRSTDVFLFERKPTGASCAAPVECRTFACSGGKCVDSCTTDDECLGDTFCDAGKCAAAHVSGTKCKRARQCASTFCVDDFCCSEARSCAPYACALVGCKTACTSNEDCSVGSACNAGKCVAGSGATCTKDLLISVGKDGTPTACQPYFCDNGTGQCRVVCSADGDCIKGYVCSSARVCTTPSPPASEGGCTIGNASGAPLALLALASFIARRRRR